MHEVLIMRHGEAAPGHPDANRRLTSMGELEAEKVARWLAQRVADGELQMPRLYVSPYARAQQTATKLADALGVSIETLDFITPDDSAAVVIDWLLEQPEGAPVLLVSHMPLVGDLTEQLVEGSATQAMGFPTAAIAELEADVWASGCAKLMRFTQPSQL